MGTRGAFAPLVSMLKEALFGRRAAFDFRGGQYLSI